MVPFDKPKGNDYYDLNSLFCAISFGGIGLILGDTFAQVVYLIFFAFIVLIMASLTFA
jgi:hypothetical protein